MTYRAVIFDLWETMVRAVATEARVRAFTVAAEACASADDFRRGWASTWPAAMRGEFRCMIDRVQAAFRFAGVDDVDPVRADEAAGLMHARYQPYLFPDVRPALTEVQARGYRLGLISNTSYDEYTVLDIYDLRRRFDVVVLSCDVGIAKPEAAIYRLAVERLGVAPEQSVFVDDTRSYVAAACALGMRGILIARPGPTDDPGTDGQYDVRIESLSEVGDWLPGKTAL